MPVLLAGLVRTLIAAALGGLVVKGWLTPDQLEQITVMVLGIAGIAGVAIWSVVSNLLKNLIAQVATSPEVAKIETTSEIAAEIPSPKVVHDPMGDLQ